MPDKEHLENLLSQVRRRLQLLEVQQAQFGNLNIPVHLQTQIEDAQKEISGLEEQLRNLSPTSVKTELPNQLNSANNLRELKKQFQKAKVNKDWDSAIALGEEILKIDTSNPEQEKNLARVYFERGKKHHDLHEYDDAFDDLTSAILLYSQEAQFHYWRGVVCFNQANFEEAISDLTEAIRQDSEYYHSYYWRGNSYLKLARKQAGLKDLNTALEKYNKALQGSPDNTYDLLYGRGLTYFDLENWFLARIDLEKVEKLGVEPFASFAREKLAAFPLEPVELLSELEYQNTNHPRRLEIGKRLDAIGDPRPGVGLRPDGLPYIEWLPVAPGGQLTIAKQNFNVQPFYIAKYPITYVQYQAFVEAPDGYNNPAWWQDFPKEYRPQKLDGQYFKGGNNPRDTISWYQSVAFARWLNSKLEGWLFPDPGNRDGAKWVIGEGVEVRLPAEWEWQWAAQGGKEQREYPWGKWQEGYANTEEAGLEQTVAVGLYPQGASPFGAMDMSGQVWEWCLNKYAKPGEAKADDSWDRRVRRGGSFYYNRVYASCAYRLSNYPNVDNFNYGFRVVVGAALSRL